MKKLKKVNVEIYLEPLDYLEVSDYKIYLDKPIVMGLKQRYQRIHQQKAHVEYEGKQQDSILFSGGWIKHNKAKYNRKFIDDILVIGSLLNGKDWALYANRSSPSYPTITRP